jgi:hypothetical protein
MITNFAGKLYNQYDSLIREISSTEEVNNKVKKFSGGGLLTRSSSMSDSDNEGMGMREEQMRLPILAMMEIRKRRNNKNET